MGKRIKEWLSAKHWLLIVPALTILTFATGCAPDESRISPSSPVDLQKGEAIAMTICSICHLYPDPNLLEREAWRLKVLPRMKLMMGLERPDPEKMHNPELANDITLFPVAPFVSVEAWRQIEAFYLAKAPEKQTALDRPAIPPTLTRFAPERLPFSIPSPTTTFVSLDETNRSILFADAKTEQLYSVAASGELLWSLVISNMAVSVRGNTTSRFIVGIGDFFPSDDHFGQVLRHDPFAVTNPPIIILDSLPRVTHLEPGDFDQDGRSDFALSIFGNLQGRFSWFQAMENGTYNEHILFPKPGAVKSIAHDFNRDGHLDLAVLFAQATEAIQIFLNDGHGVFSQRSILQKPPTFGHTDFELADFNGDGQMDFLVANGDNADFQTQPRPYHGIRIYLAAGTEFQEAFFFPFYGVYRALARDFDGDGDLDIAAVSFFPDYNSPNSEPFVFLENRGSLQFVPSTFPFANSARWLTLDAGDIDADGDIDLALGALVEMPDAVPPALKQRWASESPSILILRNQSNP